MCKPPCCAHLGLASPPPPFPSVLAPLPSPPAGLFTVQTHWQESPSLHPLLSLCLGLSSYWNVRFSPADIQARGSSVSWIQPPRHVFPRPDLCPSRWEFPPEVCRVGRSPVRRMPEPHASEGACLGEEGWKGSGLSGGEAALWEPQEEGRGSSRNQEGGRSRGGVPPGASGGEATCWLRPLSRLWLPQGNPVCALATPKPRGWFLFLFF